jgi:hypothetical protein
LPGDWQDGAGGGEAVKGKAREQWINAKRMERMGGLWEAKAYFTEMCTYSTVMV